MATARTTKPLQLARSISTIESTFSSARDFSSSDDTLSPPLVQFGIITDIQYADLPDRPAWYDASKTRYYRSSLDHVKQAFDYWTSTDSCLFALQLGDIIDGMNVKNGLNPDEALTRTLQAFDPSIPVFHVVGNHELYNFGRHRLVSLLRQNLTSQEHLMAQSPHHDEKHLYYSFIPVPGIKLIALDCFEISILGNDPELNEDNFAIAAEILYSKHGHSDEELWDCDGSLEGLERRYQAQNGGISQKQLDWLEQELADADAEGQSVIVFGHVCLHPASCDATCLLWNYDQVMEVFSRHPSVIAYMSGHAHHPGHAVDANGIHYFVFHGVIESDPSSQAFATVTLYKDKIQVEGKGTEPSISLNLMDRYSAHGKVRPNFFSDCGPSPVKSSPTVRRVGSLRTLRTSKSSGCLFSVANSTPNLVSSPLATSISSVDRCGTDEGVGQEETSDTTENAMETVAIVTVAV